MDNIKGIVTGTIITVLVGGTAYTFSQEAVVQHFADDTGLTQEQAAQYIHDIPEDELASFSEIGSAAIAEGEELLTIANEIDCASYTYQWESATLTCLQGKIELNTIAKDTSVLGKAFIHLDADTATTEDMSITIRLLDRLNADYELEMASALWETSSLDEAIKTNAYNKALLTAALESE